MPSLGIPHKLVVHHNEGLTKRVFPMPEGIHLMDAWCAEWTILDNIVKLWYNYCIPCLKLFSLDMKQIWAKLALDLIQHRQIR